MKTLLALFAILISFAASAQSIEINSNGSAANASAILDLKSTTKGFLLPRMTNAQMRAIPSPAQGLLAFCTDCGANGDYYFYKGSAWVALGSTTATSSTTVGAVSDNATANGASITNGVLSLAPADATNPGIVSTTAQTIAGAKTFSSDIIVNGITVGKGAGGQVTNTATGYQALNSNISGNDNTAHGYQALYYTTGNKNTADGYKALVNNQTGQDNTANGHYALFSNWAGSSNTATGRDALFLNSTGEYNTAIGLGALYSNTIGTYNTAIGYRADVASDNLTNATAIGNGAVVNASNKIQLGNGSVTAVQLGTGTNVTLETGLVKITGGTPGEGKVLTSDAAGLASWTTPSSIGVDLTTAQTIAGAKTFSSDINVNGITVGIGAAGIGSNTATGYKALYSNITGSGNTVTGQKALYSGTTASFNTVNGWEALYSGTTVGFNTVNGYQALYSGTLAGFNTVNGYQALYSSSSGSFNTANGFKALYSNTSGQFNTATGLEALYSNTTGYQNTANGHKALYYNTSGFNNTAIGFGADVSSGNLENATAIGAGAIVNASNKVRIGNASVTVIEGQVAWSNPSDRRLKENIQVNNNLGLNFINKLQPVTYKYISDNTKVRHDGFIAQDIEQIMKDLNLPFSGLKKSSDGMYSLAYSDFVMPLVNAVKEQQSIITELVKKNDSYESQILKLSSKLEEIEKRFSDRK